MKLLALDTATEACSAAVYIDGAVHARFEVVGREHTQRLIPVVAAALADTGLGYAQLDGLVCGVGPGSFAGVRIGVAFAKGVALAHELPVVGVSSLALLARQAPLAPGDAVLVAIDARMGEVYEQCFALDSLGLPTPLSTAAVRPPGAVTVPARVTGRWWGIGTGWGSYEPVLRERLGQLPGHPPGQPPRQLPGQPLGALDGTALPRAEHAFDLALSDFLAGRAPGAELLQPVYLRNQVALTLAEQRKLRETKG
jgi:tRNA threonylcarbamoyladenosine biosynthesis protein TsaB